MSDDELRLNDPDRFAHTDDLAPEEITADDPDEDEVDADYLAVADVMAAATPADDTRDPDAMIYMTNPDLPGDEVAQATVESFRTLWEPRGWREVEKPYDVDPTVAATTGTTPETTPDSDTKE